jgi:Chaperone of endosialidase
MGSPDVGPSVQNAADAAYAAETQYLGPQWAQAGEQAQSALANQGLNPNSAAYQNAMQQFGAQENQAYQGALNAAVAAGDAEQNTLFGQQLQSGEFANAAQAQAFGQALDNAQLGDATQQTAGQEAAYAQQLPINAFDALMSSGQVALPQAGHYTPSQAGTTNVLGAYELAGQQAQQAYQADMANYGASLGGLFNLGAAALTASDRRLKRDVRRIGRHALGVAIYAYRYLWDDACAPARIGVMAQELQPVRPDLVVDLGGGVLAVNYGGL